MSIQNNERTRLLDRVEKLEKALSESRASADKELEIKELIIQRQNEYT